MCTINGYVSIVIRTAMLFAVWEIVGWRSYGDYGKIKPAMMKPIIFNKEH
jgi:hypothetical protein